GLGGILVNDLGNIVIPQTIGGPAAGAGNIISGNDTVGVQLIGPQTTVAAGAQNNVVQGNFIGLNASGTGVGNGTGVFIDNSPNNLIGGTVAGAGNVISGNLQAGIHIFNNLSSGNLVEGNLIGTNLTGDGFPSSSNEQFPGQSAGVLIDGAPN